VSYSVLIVGLGSIGMGYDLELDSQKFVYSHARAFHQHDSFVLVGGVDQDVQKCKLFENKYCCPSYTDIVQALSKKQPDVVVISVPTQFHAEVLQKVIIHSQPQAILCEKPLAYNLSEAMEIVNSCSARGLQLYVNYIRRSDPGIIEIKRRFKTGEIVLPLKGIVWYSKGLFNNGTHFINLLEDWLGTVQDSTILSPGRLWQEIDPEPDFQLSFQQGDVVFLAAWEERYSHYTMELVSQNGRLQYSNGGHTITWQKVVQDPQFPSYKALVAKGESIHSDMDRYQLHVVEQIGQALEDKNNALCTGGEGLRTLEVIQKIMTKVKYENG